MVLYFFFDFIGEELYKLGLEVIDWLIFIVDFIDGILNFVYGFLVVCVFVGFVVDWMLMVGVVYNFFSDEFWIVIKGYGVFYLCNGSVK